MSMSQIGCLASKMNNVTNLFMDSGLLCDSNMLQGMKYNNQEIDCLIQIIAILFSSHFLSSSGSLLFLHSPHTQAL